MQPRIRIVVDPVDLGTPGARHGAGDRDEFPRSPETIPITLEAMTYGRHAADEGWATRSPKAPGRARGRSWQARWRLAGQLARQMQDRLTGRSR